MQPAGALAAVGAGGALELAAVAAAGPLLCEPLGALRAAGDGGHPPQGAQPALGIELHHGAVAERLDTGPRGVATRPYGPCPGARTRPGSPPCSAPNSSLSRPLRDLGIRSSLVVHAISMPARRHRRIHGGGHGKVSSPALNSTIRCYHLPHQRLTQRAPRDARRPQPHQHNSSGTFRSTPTRSAPTPLHVQRTGPAEDEPPSISPRASGRRAPATPMSCCSARHGPTVLNTLIRRP